jgi:hypothetical protein
MLKIFKYYILGVKVLIPISFFVMANLLGLSSLSQAALNGIAGGLAALTIFMYLFEYMLAAADVAKAEALQLENKALIQTIKGLQNTVNQKRIFGKSKV